MIVMNMGMNITVIIKIILILMTFDNGEDEVKMPRDCLIETALAEETRLEAKLLNDTEIELYKVFVLFVGWLFTFLEVVP